jgi:large subunit ribosomal protein L20
VKRRNFRALWIVRINAAARQNGTSYSKLTAALKKAGVVIDRKILADLAAALPGDFAAVVKAANA